MVLLPLVTICTQVRQKRRLICIYTRLQRPKQRAGHSLYSLKSENSNLGKIPTRSLGLSLQDMWLASPLLARKVHCSWKQSLQRGWEWWVHPPSQLLQGRGKWEIQKEICKDEGAEKTPISPRVNSVTGKALLKRTNKWRTFHDKWGNAEKR